jgi:Circularly permutated YpsA SLOG family
VKKNRSKTKAHFCIISGGQTGVDRAALDVARELEIPCGGWVPKGRRAEDGAIPERYPLREMPSPGYPARTDKNVREATGTLILTWGSPTGGTALTIRLARKQGKPFFLVDLAEGGDPKTVRDWIRRNAIKILNVAGPRESQFPGIHDQATIFLGQVLKKGLSYPRVRESQSPDNAPLSRDSNPSLDQVR